MLPLTAKEGLSQAWEKVYGLNSASLPSGVRIYLDVNIGPGCSPSVVGTDPSQIRRPRTSPARRQRAAARAAGSALAQEPCVARAAALLAPAFVGFGSSLMFFSLWQALAASTGVVKDVQIV